LAVDPGCLLGAKPAASPAFGPLADEASPGCSRDQDLSN
jgi:hypothetical protein